MPKIIAIHGGGDWYDASADYVVLPNDMDIHFEHEQYCNWYKNEYCPALRAHKKPKYVTFVEWLLKAGARETTDNELEVFNEVAP